MNNLGTTPFGDTPMISCYEEGTPIPDELSGLTPMNGAMLSVTPFSTYEDLPLPSAVQINSGYTDSAVQTDLNLLEELKAQSYDLVREEIFDAMRHPPNFNGLRLPYTSGFTEYYDCGRMKRHYYSSDAFYRTPPLAYVLYHACIDSDADHLQWRFIRELIKSRSYEEYDSYDVPGGLYTLYGYCLARGSSRSMPRYGLPWIMEIREGPFSLPRPIVVRRVGEREWIAHDPYSPCAERLRGRKHLTALLETFGYVIHNVQALKKLPTFTSDRCVSFRDGSLALHSYSLQADKTRTSHIV